MFEHTRRLKERERQRRLRAAFVPGRIISLGLGSRYGVIDAVDEADGRLRVICKYVDPATGDRMVCPDARCKGHCVICSVSRRPEWLYTDAMPDFGEPWPDYDLAFYHASGMLTEALAVAASTEKRLVDLDAADAALAADFRKEYGPQK